MSTCITFFYTQQLFKFQKLIFSLIPWTTITIPEAYMYHTTGLFVNVWLHIHHTADMKNDGMSAILCNRSLWSHFCSSKIYMRPAWTLLNCIWRFSTLQRRYLTFGDVSVRWRWVKVILPKRVFGCAKPLDSFRTFANLCQKIAHPVGNLSATPKNKFSGI